MLKAILAAAILLLPASVAQTPDPAREAFNTRLSRLRDITVEAVRLTPSAEFIALPESDRPALTEKTAGVARENEPKVRALLAELDAMAPLAPLNDPKRDAPMNAFRAEVRAAVAGSAARLTDLQQPMGAGARALNDKLFAGWSAGFNAARDMELALAHSFMLDLSDTDDHDAAEAFVHVFSARNAFVGMAESKEPTPVQLAQLSQAVADLEALATRLKSSARAPGPKFVEAIIFTVGILKAPGERLRAPGDKETLILASILGLSRGTRALIEAM